MCNCFEDLEKCGGISPVKKTDEMTEPVGQLNGKLYAKPIRNNLIALECEDDEDDHIVCQYTFAELKELEAQGMQFIAVYDGDIYHAYDVSQTVFKFRHIDIVDNAVIESILRTLGFDYFTKIDSVERLLPTVTSEDAGKILTVSDDGKWEAT